MSEKCERAEDYLLSFIEEKNSSLRDEEIPIEVRVHFMLCAHCQREGQELETFLKFDKEVEEFFQTRILN